MLCNIESIVQSMEEESQEITSVRQRPRKRPRKQSFPTRVVRDNHTINEHDALDRLVHIIESSPDKSCVFIAQDGTPDEETQAIGIGLWNSGGLQSMMRIAQEIAILYEDVAYQLNWSWKGIGEWQP